MSKWVILVLVSVILSSAKASNVNPALICTEDIRVALDDTMQLATSFMKGPLSPSLVIIKHLLGSITKFLGDCQDIHTDLTRFDVCVDKLANLQPLLRRLVDDISRGRKSETIADVSQIVAYTVQELTPCFKQQA